MIRIILSYRGVFPGSQVKKKCIRHFGVGTLVELVNCCFDHCFAFKLNEMSYFVLFPALLVILFSLLVNNFVVQTL